MTTALQNPMPSLTDEDRNYYPGTESCCYKLDHKFHDGRVAMISFCGDYAATQKMRCYVKLIEGTGPLPLATVDVLIQVHQVFVNEIQQEVTLLHTLPSGRQLAILATPQPRSILTIS